MNTTAFSRFQRTGTWFSLLAALSLGLASAAFGQLQWSSYDKNGNQVTANVGSGGDAAYGGSVSFTVPATTELVFTTKTFVPTSLAAAGTSAKINFTLSSSGGLSPGNSGRVIGMGWLNDPGTPSSALDDTGYWTDLNTGNNPPSFELFYRPDTVTTFFQYDSAHKLGSGKVSTGYPSNGVPYGMQFQLNESSGATAISIGTSSSTFAAAGAALTNGSGAVVIQSYSSANNLTTLPTTTFNEFAVMFNNGSASAVTVTLSGITLVPANPFISSQPANFSGSPGDTATFTATISTNSAGPLAYQWYEITGGITNVLADGTTVNGSTISGAQTNALNFANAQIADSGSLFVVVTNVYGATTSGPVLMNILPPTAPTITSIIPTNATVIAGNNTNIVVSAIASPTPTYYWFDNNNSLLQSSSVTVLTLANVQPAGAGTYSVIASNYLGTATNHFTINVIVTPAISSQPTNLLLNVGDPATFAVTATGVPAPTYQWYQGASAIPDATNSTYAIGAVALTNLGSYKVVVSNAAGAVASSNAILAIYSPTLTGAPLAPANHASGVCYDTSLTLSFNQPPVVGTTGKISIYNAANPSTPLDTLDLSQNLPNGTQSRAIGDDTFNTYPVIINGNTAVIYPHLDLLTSNQTYYVTLDPGVFVDTNGAYFAGFAGTSTWQFTTKAGGPANPTNLVVAADGSGDFDTVQGAIDSVASGNITYTLIKVHNGFYQEIVDIDSKNNLLLRGQSRAGTIIGYANNAAIAPGGSTHARMAFKVNANDIALDNLTVTNLTPQDSSQAEALMIESGAARIIVNNCNVDSYQDTILANVSTSKAYFNRSLIQGDVDFIWGGGNLFFTNCEIRYLIRAGNGAALGPNPSPSAGDISSNGFSFVNCALTTLPGANPNDTVGRTRGITNGNTALINCLVSTNIGGWYADALPTGNYRNWYYHCTNDLGVPVTLSNGIALSVSDPNVALAGSATAWLYGWQPQLAPNILTNPASLTAGTGQPAGLAAGATGIPDPTYQWFQNGDNLPAATNATLLIPAVQAGNGGSYYVVVSNNSGSVTSSIATLTYSVVLPVAGPDFTMGALLGVSTTVPIIGGKYSPTDADNNPLTIISVTGATNGTVTTDGTNVTYTATNGTGDAFTYTVSDGFGGTASATVTVAISSNVQGYNQLEVANLGNGTNVLTFAGIPTCNYALDLATNLVPPINWMPQVTNPAANNGVLIYTNVSTEPQSFYRTRYVP